MISWVESDVKGRRDQGTCLGKQMVWWNCKLKDIILTAGLKQERN